MTCELSDVIGGAPQPARGVITPICFDDPARREAQEERLRKLHEEAWAEERAERRAARDAEIATAARDEGRRLGYVQGHIDGTHWGMVCGAIGTATLGGALGALAVLARAKGWL